MDRYFRVAQTPLAALRYWVNQFRLHHLAGRVTGISDTIANCSARWTWRTGARSRMLEFVKAQRRAVLQDDEAGGALAQNFVGTGAIATCATAGWPAMAISMSMGLNFTPPRLISSLVRPRSRRCPPRPCWQDRPVATTRRQ